MGAAASVTEAAKPVLARAEQAARAALMPGTLPECQAELARTRSLIGEMLVLIGRYEVEATTTASPAVTADADAEATAAATTRSARSPQVAPSPALESELPEHLAAALALLRNKLHERWQTLHDAFKGFDVEGHDGISAEEFHLALTKANMAGKDSNVLSDAEVALLSSFFDKNDRYVRNLLLFVHKFTYVYFQW